MLYLSDSFASLGRPKAAIADARHAFCADGIFAVPGMPAGAKSVDLGAVTPQRKGLKIILNRDFETSH